LASAMVWAVVPSWLKSNAPDFRLGSGSRASSRALGVQDIQRLDPEALSSACVAMMLSFMQR